jgi:hypothetical protein
MSGGLGLSWDYLQVDEATGMMRQIGSDELFERSLWVSGNLSTIGMTPNTHQ